MSKKKSKAEETPAVNEEPAAEAQAPETEEATATPEELLAERAAQIAQLASELLYQQAELDNFKKRTEKRYQDMLRFATDPLVRDLLAVVDNLERALTHADEGDANVAGIVEGLGHILGQLGETLVKHGVETIEPEGKKFDPNLHEAMGQIAGEEAGMVAMVLEKGYALHSRLLRPAKVMVSRLATPPKND